MDFRKSVSNNKSTINSRITSDLERRKLEAELKAAEEIAKIKENLIEKRLALELASLENDTDFKHAPVPLSQFSLANDSTKPETTRKESNTNVATVANPISICRKNPQMQFRSALTQSKKHASQFNAIPRGGKSEIFICDGESSTEENANSQMNPVLVEENQDGNEAGGETEPVMDSHQKCSPKRHRVRGTLRQTTLFWKNCVKKLKETFNGAHGSNKW